MYFMATALLLCLNLYTIRVSPINKSVKIWHFCTFMLTFAAALSLAALLKTPLLTPLVLCVYWGKRLITRSLLQRREKALYIRMLKAYALQQRLTKMPPISAIQPHTNVLKDDNLKKAS